jgi:hypothetical protein
MEWAPVYHVKGWGKFNRHYEDFCTGADISDIDEWRCWAAANSTLATAPQSEEQGLI